MPIYEYSCKSCGDKFECMQRISEAPVAPCPRCGTTADRMISQTSFALKGSGWYKDGYSKGKKAEVKAEAEAKAKAEAKVEAKAKAEVKAKAKE